MSKSLRNYTDPNEVINKFGADALRLFLIHSAVVRAEDLKYSDDGVRDVLKGILIPLWNSYSFFVTYANIDKIMPTVAPKNPSNPLDKWILSLAQKMVQDVTFALDSYDLSKAVDPLISFIDQLNNWYIRRSRRRFWKSENDNDKNEAYASLYSVLKTLTLISAPFIPFISENIWQNLRTSSEPISVHLCDYPKYNEKDRDLELEFKMDTVQKTVSMGRSLRYQFNLKIRQPLKNVELVTRDPKEKKVLLEMEDSIREELNVKNVVFHEKEDELVCYSAKANFKVLGKELGSSMRLAAEKIEKLQQEEIQSLLEGATLSLEVDGKTIELTSEKIVVNRLEKEHLKVINEGTLTVGLDTEITKELLMEGSVRDLIRGVQNLRKERGLEVTDRISLSVSGNENLKEAFEAFTDFISGETLATSAKWVDTIGNNAVEIEAGDDKWKADLAKA